MQTAVQAPGGIQTSDPNGLGNMSLYVLQYATVRTGLYL